MKSFLLSHRVFVILEINLSQNHRISLLCHFNYQLDFHCQPKVFFSSLFFIKRKKISMIDCSMIIGKLFELDELLRETFEERIFSYRLILVDSLNILSIISSEQ